VFVALHVWGVLHDGPLLLSGADPKKRIELYGQIAATAVALLGISLTVLAILVALPERPAVAEIRNSDTWPLLQGLLLTIALLALICLLSAHLGSAIDDAPVGREWIEQILFASAVVGILALLVAGLTFWLVLGQADDPPDPSKGRGQGA
jgi:hypothetical protein